MKNEKWVEESQIHFLFILDNFLSQGEGKVMSWTRILSHGARKVMSLTRILSQGARKVMSLTRILSQGARVLYWPPYHTKLGMAKYQFLLALILLHRGGAIDLAIWLTDWPTHSLTKDVFRLSEHPYISAKNKDSDMEISGYDPCILPSICIMFWMTLLSLSLVRNPQCFPNTFLVDPLLQTPN